jgi:hypothetical protein
MLELASQDGLLARRAVAPAPEARLLSRRCRDRIPRRPVREVGAEDIETGAARLPADAVAVVDQAADLLQGEAVQVGPHPDDISLDHR